VPIIEDGRESAILRPDQGWESVVAFLRQRTDEPVVTYYSVTDSFPNRYIADGVGDDGAEGSWYDLLKEEKWRTTMEGLRRTGAGLEMRPDVCGPFETSTLTMEIRRYPSLTPHRP